MDYFDMAGEVAAIIEVNYPMGIVTDVQVPKRRKG